MPNEGNAPPIIDFQVYLSSLITTCTNIQRVTKFFESSIFLPIFNRDSKSISCSAYLSFEEKRNLFREQTCSLFLLFLLKSSTLSPNFSRNSASKRKIFRPIDFHPTTLLIFRRIGFNSAIFLRRKRRIRHGIGGTRKAVT